MTVNEGMNSVGRTNAAEVEAENDEEGAVACPNWASWRKLPPLVAAAWRGA
jgi:hypothetical protein